MKNFRNMCWAAALALATGCGVGTGGTSQVSLSARALQSSNGIQIDRVRVVIRELELKAPIGTSISEAGSDAGWDDSGAVWEIEQGPYLIDLQGEALDGRTVHLLDAQVPTGTYQEIEFKVEPLRSASSSDSRFAELASARASLMVDGLIDGTPFRFASALETEQERHGTLVLDGSDNITLNLDPSGWFVGSGGARLDPRDAANRSFIEANIRSSIDLYDDDDYDGWDDSHHRSGSSDGGSSDGGCDDDQDGGSDDDDDGFDDHGGEYEPPHEEDEQEDD